MDPTGELWTKAESGLWRPKYDIAEIVEVLGIRVPRRFAGFEDAYKHLVDGGSIIIRSEHPEDYDGPSGLAESYVITPENINDPDPESDDDRSFMIKILAAAGTENEARLHDLWRYMVPGMNKNVVQYLKMYNRPIDEYFETFGYSLWEYIPGTNMTIVADDAIDGRYHVFATTGSVFSHYGGAICNSVGGVILGGEGRAPGTKDGRLRKRFSFDPSHTRAGIETYEQVRDLYNKNNCPIIELQIDNSGTIWFLQLKKGRDCSIQTERLKPRDFPQQDGWVKAPVVRGSTSLEIINRPTVIRYSEDIGHYVPIHPDFREPASTGTLYNTARRELLGRHRDVWATGRYNDADYYYGAMAMRDHVTKTEWLMSDTGMAFGKEVLRNAIGEGMMSALEDQMPDLRELMRRQRKYSSILPAVVMQYASDGRQGFARRNPEYNDPVEIDYSKPAQAL